MSTSLSVKLHDQVPPKSFTYPSYKMAPRKQQRVPEFVADDIEAIMEDYKESDEKPADGDIREIDAEENENHKRRYKFASGSWTYVGTFENDKLIKEKPAPKGAAAPSDELEIEDPVIDKNGKAKKAAAASSDDEEAKKKKAKNGAKASTSKKAASTDNEVSEVDDEPKAPKASKAKKATTDDATKKTAAKKAAPVPAPIAESNDEDDDAEAEDAPKKKGEKKPRKSKKATLGGVLEALENMQIGDAKRMVIDMMEGKGAKAGPENTRQKSQYNIYMSTELTKAKIEHPEMDSKDRFKMVLGNYKDYKQTLAAAQ